ncbi:MAG TPA: GDSL-type esterase/lipase family protein [Candidatus Hydrogenedentes bacterium]|nr:GDSL-type esterase/lipase family protein [Candidatus Hydrogenedentota bacterium]
MKIAVLVGLVAMCLIAAAQAQEPQPNVQVDVVDFVETTIYHSPETPGYTSWVGLWQLPNGTVCCDFRQVIGPKDKPVSSVPVLGSQDGGDTWTVLTATAPSADPGMLGGYTVSSDGCRGMAVLADGTLVRPLWPSSDIKDSGSVRRSTDGGKTWSEKIFFLPAEEYRTWPSLVRPLRDGRLILFAGCWKRGDCAAGTRNDAVFAGGQEGMLPNMTKMMFVSSDQGQTWSAPIVLMPASVGVCEESDFCELPNGDLFWIHRTEHYPDHQTDLPPLAARMGPNPPESYWYSDRMQSIAHKQGDTFVPGECTPAPFPHSGYPCVLLTREGVILHLATGESHWSADEGKTWNTLMVGDRPLGTYYYPKAIQMADGRILCIGHLGSDDVYGTVDQCIKQQTFRLNVRNAPGAPEVPPQTSTTATMRGDSLVLVKTDPGKLCYDNLVEDTVSVRNTYEPGQANTVVYEEGRDYVVDCVTGTIARTADSRIPDFSTNMLYGQKEFDHNLFPGFGNRPFFVFVDYKTRAAFSLCEKTDQAALLPKTAEKLRKGGPFKIVAYGDSITAGGDASSLPLQFQERWARYLAERFPQAQITVENGATGGDATAQGLQRLREKVLDRAPDLVLIGFGMNDHNIGGPSPEQFTENLKIIVTQIRDNTGAEAILFSAFPPNPDWKFGSHRMELYAAATRRAAEQLGCAYADVFGVWTKVLARKDLPSLLGNNINHPNDFGHGLYFEALKSVEF